MHNILWELNRAVFHTNRSLALSCWWRTNGKNYPCSRRRQSDESCQYQDDWIDLDCLRTLFATQLVQASGKKHCRTPKPGDDSYQSVSFRPKGCVLVIHSTYFGFVHCHLSILVSEWDGRDDLKKQWCWRQYQQCHFVLLFGVRYSIWTSRLVWPALAPLLLWGWVRRSCGQVALSTGTGWGKRGFSQVSTKRKALRAVANRPRVFQDLPTVHSKPPLPPPSGTGLSINRK